jgi:3-oxoacyl-[acyl-carrier protein] reductase
MSAVRFDFTGQSVIVTGAARGIGLAIATRFLGAGAAVTLVDADGAVLDEVCGRIGGHPATADVTDTAAVEAVVADVIAGEGKVDVLINNAGVLRDNLLWKLSDDEWSTVLDVHAGGTFRFTRACIPTFRAQKRGRVVNVTSYTGLHGNVGQANYATAKAGIIGFTMTAARELAHFGITVNAISPNAETRMIASIPEAKRAELAAAIPMGRFAEPSEVTGAVCFPRLGRGELCNRRRPAGRRRHVHLTAIRSHPHGHVQLCQ